MCNKTSKVSHLQATINPPHNEKHPPVDTSPASFFFMPCSELFGRAAGERAAWPAGDRPPTVSSLLKTSEGLV